MPHSPILLLAIPHTASSLQQADGSWRIKYPTQTASQAGLAGGSNTLLLPITSCTIAALGALSLAARCKTFDASADG